MKDGTKIDPNAEPKATKETEAAPALDEADSPFTFGSYISYSFSPDHSNPHSLQTEMYLRYVMCTSATSLFAYTIEGNFHKRYPFWIPFFVEKD